MHLHILIMRDNYDLRGENARVMMHGKPAPGASFPYSRIFSPSRARHDTTGFPGAGFN
jgi:hypothetical protein